jgi:predicted phosphodiesterase
MNTTTHSRVAVLSDIHGNRWALEAVLEEVGRRGVRAIVNLGDSLYGPMDPAGTAEILVPLGLPTVRGNEDRLTSSAFVDSPTVRFVRGQLEPIHVDWLATLPSTTVAFGELFMCHGTPEHDDEYLLQVVSRSGVRRRTSSELCAALRDVSAPVVLCGHDHLPAVAPLPDGRIVVDPGSVGLPAYFDETPYPHTMESGSPQARFTILSRSAGGWRAENVAVPYDHTSAAAAAEKNDRADWAEWLRTGCAQASRQKYE